MKSFLINLDRSPERLLFFTRQAEQYGLAFDRVSAVDGRKLSAVEIQSALDPCFEFQPINECELGLFLSHRAIWERVVGENIPAAAIFEDDVVLSPQISTALAALDRCEMPYDLIKIETTLRKVVCGRVGVELPSGQALHLLRSWHGGTAGYIVSHRGASKLLAAKEKISDQVDQVLFNPISRVSAALAIYQLLPALCIQKDILSKNDPAAFGSTIERAHSRGRLFRHGMFIDARRLINKQRERLRRNRLALSSSHIQLRVPFAHAAGLPEGAANDGSSTAGREAA